MNGPYSKCSVCAAKADIKLHRFQLAVMNNKELRINSNFPLQVYWKNNS